MSVAMSDINPKEDPERQEVEEEEEEFVPLGTALADIFYAFAPLGWIAFGGPQAHIGLFKQKFVPLWISEERFLELLGLCQGLPGPTSTQMATAMGAARGGVLGGLLSFTLFQFPGFLIMTVAGVLLKELLAENGGPPREYLEATVGLPPAAISQVFLAAYGLGMTVCKANGVLDEVKVGLAAVTAFVTLLLEPTSAPWAYPLMLAIGGAITAIDAKYNEKRAHVYPLAVPEDKNILKRIGVSPLMGGILVLIWVGLLLGSIVVRNTAPAEGGNLFHLFESFWRMGSIIFGGGQVVLPMLEAEVVSPGWVDETSFYNGLALVQSLPGPLFNFAAYLGGVFQGLPGAFVAFFGLFGPGVLLIFAFLPFWETARQNTLFRTFLVGVNSSAIGLVVAACALLYEKAIFNFGGAAVCLFSGTLVGAYGVEAPLAILAGGFLGWALMRANFGGPYCNVPAFYEEYIPQSAGTCAALTAYRASM